MTDRELLELAAKAAGIKVVAITHNGVAQGKNGACYIDYWNPLTDDGDALRLAVKLNILRAYVYEGEVSMAPSDYGIVEVVVGRDPVAATRRAIVRAAAEIGKAMP